MCKLHKKEDQSHKPINRFALPHNTLQDHMCDVTYAQLRRNKKLQSSVFEAQSQPINKLTFPCSPYQ
jgi:hypothetical protein